MTLEHDVAAAGDDRVCGQRWALQWIEPREGSEYSKCAAVLTPAVCVTHTLKHVLVIARFQDTIGLGSCQFMRLQRETWASEKLRTQQAAVGGKKTLFIAATEHLQPFALGCSLYSYSSSGSA